MLLINELNNPTIRKYNKSASERSIKLIKIINMSDNLDFSEIENISDAEQKVFEYAKKQDITFLTNIDDVSITMIENTIAVTFSKRLLHGCNSLERLISISHEIGHFLDLKLYHNNDTNGFNTFYCSKKSNMIESELIAWMNAEKMLKHFGFTDWEYFFKLMFECLTTYTDGDTNRSKELIKRRNIIDKIHSEYVKAFYDEKKDLQKVMDFIKESE